VPVPSPVCVVRAWLAGDSECLALSHPSTHTLPPGRPPPPPHTHTHSCPRPHQACVKRLVGTVQRLRTFADRDMRQKCLTVYLQCLQSSSLSWRMFAADELVSIVTANKQDGGVGVVAFAMGPCLPRGHRSSHLPSPLLHLTITTDGPCMPGWHCFPPPQLGDRALVSLLDLLAWMTSDEVKLFEYLIGDKMHPELLKRCTPLLTLCATNGKITSEHLSQVRPRGAGGASPWGPHSVGRTPVSSLSRGCCLLLQLPLCDDVCGRCGCERWGSTSPSATAFACAWQRFASTCRWT
jgi:hypothetical protein